MIKHESIAIYERNISWEFNRRQSQLAIIYINVYFEH